MSYFHDKKISSRKKNILNYIWGGDKKVKKKHAKTGKFCKKNTHKKNTKKTSPEMWLRLCFLLQENSPWCGGGANPSSRLCWPVVGALRTVGQKEEHGWTALAEWLRDGFAGRPSSLGLGDLREEVTVPGQKNEVWQHVVCGQSNPPPNFVCSWTESTGGLGKFGWWTQPDPKVNLISLDASENQPTQRRRPSPYGGC